MIFAKENGDLVDGFPAWRSESTKTLICTHDAMHKKLLNELLSTLIFSYREGAHERDNRNRLPLHEALWCGAEMDTIALFLMAKPEATNEVDHRGRSLADGGPPQTLPWPQQGGDAAFAESKSRLWKSARAEASLRLRLGTLSEETSLTGGSRDPILSVTRDAKSKAPERKNPDSQALGIRSYCKNVGRW